MRSLGRRRRGIIRSPEGTRRLQNISNNSPALHSYLPLLARAFAIASQFRVGVYDCLYVALAERELCKHLTADDRLIRAPADFSRHHVPGIPALNSRGKSGIFEREIGRSAHTYSLVIV